MKKIVKILRRLFTTFTIFVRDILIGFEWAERNRHHSMWGKF